MVYEHGSNFKVDDTSLRNIWRIKWVLIRQEIIRQNWWGAIGFQGQLIKSHHFDNLQCLWSSYLSACPLYYSQLTIFTQTHFIPSKWNSLNFCSMYTTLNIDRETAQLRNNYRPLFRHFNICRPAFEFNIMYSFITFSHQI